MSLTTNNRVKLVAPSVATLLPEGHYRYDNAGTTTFVKKRRLIRIPTALMTAFRGLGIGMKILFGTLFFLACLAIPTFSAAAVFNMAAASDPVETMRTQEVPSSGVVEQPRSKGIQIDISWVED